MTPRPFCCAACAASEVERWFVCAYWLAGLCAACSRLMTRTLTDGATPRPRLAERLALI